MLTLAARSDQVQVGRKLDALSFHHGHLHLQKEELICTGCHREAGLQRFPRLWIQGFFTEDLQASWDGSFWHNSKIAAQVIFHCVCVSHLYSFIC